MDSFCSLTPKTQNPTPKTHTMKYQTFDTLDALLDWIKRHAKTVDGKYAAPESVEFSEQIERQTEEAARLKTERDAESKRAKDAEKKLKAAEPKITELETEIEDLKSSKPENEKLRDAAEKLKEANRLRAEAESQNRELADKLSGHDELVKQFEEIKGREQNRTIIDAVRKEAKDLKIPESVLTNDALVERYLAHGLTLDDATGKVYGKDNTSLRKHLETLQKSDPTILAPRSEGAGAQPGGSNATIPGSQNMSLAESLAASRGNS